MAGQNTGKIGNFKSIKQAQKEKQRKSDANKKKDFSKRQAGLNKSKKKPKK